MPRDIDYDWSTADLPPTRAERDAMAAVVADDLNHLLAMDRFFIQLNGAYQRNVANAAALPDPDQSVDAMILANSMVSSIADMNDELNAAHANFAILLNEAEQRGISVGGDIPEGLGELITATSLLVFGIVALLTSGAVIAYTMHDHLVNAGVAAQRASAIANESAAKIAAYARATGGDPLNPFVPAKLPDFPGGNSPAAGGSGGWGDQLDSAAGGVTKLLVVGIAAWFLLPLLTKKRRAA